MKSQPRQNLLSATSLLHRASIHFTGRNQPQKPNRIHSEQLFKKQVDKLQTDHQGTFVLKDSNFRWTSRYAEGERFRA